MEPIYQSNGDWVAVYNEGHVFNADGEWLGFVQGRDVYDPNGRYLGFLSNDRRLLRRRQLPDKPQLKPPPRPSRPRIPASMPLSPMLRALPYHYIDMFEEYPERFLYFSDTRPDME